MATDKQGKKNKVYKRYHLAVNERRQMNQKGGVRSGFRESGCNFIWVVRKGLTGKGPLYTNWMDVRL